MNDDWPLVRVDELLEASIGGVWGSDPGESDVDVTVFRSTDFNADGHLSLEKGARRSVTTSQLASRQMRHGDVLLEKSGGGPNQPVGRVAYVEGAVPEPSVCANFIQFLRPDTNRVVCKYLFYALWADHSNNVTLQYQAQTTGIRNLRTKDYLARQIAVPPLPVQRRIVDLMAHLDNQIANLRTERDAAGTLLVSARDELLQTGSDWTSTRLSGVTTKIGSGATPRGGESAYRAEGVSLIRSQNVYDLRFEWDGLAHIGPEQARLLDNVTVEQGDVLLNITGASVNRCCIVPDVALPARVNQHVAIIRSNRSFVVPDFLVHLLRRSDTLALLNRMAGAGTTRQALTKNQIEQLDITIPEVSEQQRLAGILTSLNRQVSALQTEIDALSEARGAALSSVLSGQAALSSDYDSLLDGVA